jgi:FAD/FMN-containing dehydrogenase
MSTSLPRQAPYRQTPARSAGTRAGRPAAVPTAAAGHDLNGLRSRFSGRVITAADGDYDQARSVWNGAIDAHPAVIARCAGAGDVAAAVDFAQDAGLEISVRGGAHSFAGASVGDDGLTIDLSAISQVTVDPGARTARAGGGATLAQLDAATQAHGLAVPAGTVSHTGIGGLTLGGGFGWLTSQYGLSCDNLRSAQVVTAAGQVLRASHDQYPELFWALRGGGGNFGVVTEFEFQLHPVGPLAQLGLFFWDADDGQAALTLAQQVTADLPPRMGALIFGGNAPPAPFVPQQHHFRPGYGLIVAAFGADAGHARLAGQIRSALPPLVEFTTPIPYTALQQIIDEAAPWGILAYQKALYLDALTPEVISIITAQLPRKQSPLSQLLAVPLGGAFCQVPDEATAFGGSRAPCVVVDAAAFAPEPGLLAADRDWARQLWAGLLPYSQGPGSYVNLMADYQADRVQASYGPAKYQRLTQIKAAYDPGNVFHRNANINPAG